MLGIAEESEVAETTGTEREHFEVSSTPRADLLSAIYNFGTRIYKQDDCGNVRGAGR